MVKGVFIAFGIMLVLAVIPIVHFIGIPFGPFIGGYFGISAASSSGGTYAVKSLIFGALLGAMIFVVLAAVALILMAATGLNMVLVWLVAVVATMYVSSMSSLGALYAQLRSAEKDSSAQEATLVAGADSPGGPE
ncbi:MAG: hypothetical protein BZY88_12470 [SAR202 cluster bacterium Io17-Chloro-G9]|nr:MAG: hypothetical protein BZY88_12470 [SAR202 cluster bacterium Io17-Chloro-G9]